MNEQPNEEVLVDPLHRTDCRGLPRINERALCSRLATADGVFRTGRGRWKRRRSGGSVCRVAPSTRPFSQRDDQRDQPKPLAASKAAAVCGASTFSPELVSFLCSLVTSPSPDMGVIN